MKLYETNFHRLAKAAARAAYWNSEGREDEGTMIAAFELATVLEVDGHTVHDLIDAAIEYRTRLESEYLAAARDILAAAD